MKKYIILTVLGVSLLLSIFPDKSHAASIGEIGMSFCNNTGQDNKTLTLSGEASQDIPLCISFSNNAPTDASITINFVDGTITNDGSKKKACLEEWTKTFFGQYVSGIDTSHHYTIPARQSIQLTWIMDFPDRYAGDMIGCLTYALTDQQSNSWAINVFVRKANIITIALSGEIRRQIHFMAVSWSYYDSNFSPDPQILLYHDSEWKYVLSFSLFNSGNVTESVNLQGKVSNTWWRSHDLSLENKEIAPWMVSSYSIILDLPRYGGSYTLSLSGQSMPIFLLPNSSYSNIDTWNMSISRNITFSKPWNMRSDNANFIIIGLSSGTLFIIVLCFILIRRRKKKKIWQSKKVIAKRKSTTSMGKKISLRSNTKTAKTKQKKDK